MPLPDELLQELPEELRDNETLGRFNNLGDLAKSYVEARSALGNAIRVPGPDAGDEDKAKFYEKLINHAPNMMMKPDFSEPEQADQFFEMLGRPKEADGYNKPEGVELDPNVEAELRSVFHEAGMTDNQFQKVMTELANRDAQRVEAMTDAAAEATRDLQGEWGTAFDSRNEAARKINEQFYPGREFDNLTPAEIKGLYQTSVALTGKGPQAATQDGQHTQGMTPAEAKERMEEIMRRVHDPESGLSHDEKMRLIQKRIDIAKTHLGMNDDLNTLRAGR